MSGLPYAAPFFSHMRALCKPSQHNHGHAGHQRKARRRREDPRVPEGREARTGAGSGGCAVAAAAVAAAPERRASAEGGRRASQGRRGLDRRARQHRFGRDGAQRQRRVGPVGGRDGDDGARRCLFRGKGREDVAGDGRSGVFPLVREISPAGSGVSGLCQVHVPGKGVVGEEDGGRTM